MHYKLVLRHHKMVIHQKLQAPNEVMPCDKHFGYVRLTQGLTCGCYGDLKDYDMMSETNMCKTNPEDHIIISCEFLMGIKAHTMNSSM